MILVLKKNFAFLWQISLAAQYIYATSISIERIFSIFGHVWSKLRNSVALEKINKFVKMYRYV